MTKLGVKCMEVLNSDLVTQLSAHHILTNKVQRLDSMFSFFAFNILIAHVRTCILVYCRLKENLKEWVSLLLAWFE